MSNDQDLLQEVNRAVQDIIEAMLQAMLKGMEEQQRLEQEMLIHAYRAVGKEMGNQLVKQLNEQIKEIKLSQIDLPKVLGKEPQYLIHDQNGKPYQISGLDKEGRIELSPVDGKGAKVAIDPRQLRLPFKVERSLLMITKPKETALEKSIARSMKQWITDKTRSIKDFAKNLKDKVLQPDLIKGDLRYLEERKEAFEKTKYAKSGMEKRLSRIDQQMDQTTDKKELAELQAERKELTKYVAGCDKFMAQEDQQLTRSLQARCPELTKEGLDKLDFREKHALAQTAISQEHSLTKEQLRDVMEEKGNEKGLEALDKAEDQGPPRDR